MSCTRDGLDVRRDAVRCREVEHLGMAGKVMRAGMVSMSMLKRRLSPASVFSLEVRAKSCAPRRAASAFSRGSS
jgi:hypothetical protein